MSKKTVVRMATSRPVQVSDIWIAISPSALRDAAKSINDDAALRMSVEHDPYAVSVLKTGKAWTEPYEEFESLVVELLESRRSQIVTPDTEQVYVLMEFPPETLPFVCRPETDRLSVNVDLANFDSINDLERFQSVVSADGTRTKRHERRSLVPDPIITIALPGLGGLVALVVTYFVLKPIYTGYSNAVARLSEQFFINAAKSFGGIKIAGMNRKSQDVLTAYRDHQSPDGRPILVERIFKGPELDIIVLERVNPDGELADVDFQDIVEELAEQGRIVLGAREITLIRDDDGKLNFWYLHTKDGHVIATEAALQYTNDAINRLAEGKDRTHEKKDE